MIAAARSLEGVRVLVVDRDEAGRRALEIVLRKAGAGVATAPTPRKAIETLQVEFPDIVVLDHSIPRPLAHDVVDRLHVLIPVGRARALAMVLSGDAAPGTLRRTYGGVFDAELGKPVDPETLTGLIAALLRARHLTRAATIEDPP